MSAFPTKNLIFLKDSKSNLNFLVDSGASISILPHSSSAPPTGPHLVGANGNIVPVWGRRQIVSFAGHDFEFNFFLAAVATPIIGMDFLTNLSFQLSQQNGRFFTWPRAAPSHKQVPVLLLAPGAPRPPPPSPPSRPRYKNSSKNFRRYCAPVPRHPRHSMA
jgi:hypothetical protein